MNLQQLRYLVAAADTGSFSGAARAERVSQPVVSRALHALEREHGLLLFRREGRRVGLTDAGAALVAAARRAVDAVDDVERVAQRLALGRELVVVSTPTNSALISSVVARFIRLRPQASLRLRRANAMDEVEAMVAAREADLGFGDLTAPVVHDHIHREPLWRVEVVLVSPVGADLPAVVPHTLLADLPLVLPPEDSERRESIDGLVVGASGQRPDPVLATDERSAWATSARQGIGSFLSYRAVAEDLDDVDVRDLSPALDVVVGFVHASDGISDDGQALIDLAWRGDPPPGCHPV